MHQRRKNTRFPGFEYSLPNAYFVTICVEKRVHYLGSIQNGKVQLIAGGEIADQSWRITQEHFDDLRIDSHVTMPNHVHAIVMILTHCQGGVTPPLRRKIALGEIIGFYKYQTTKQINILTNSPGKRFWQRNYYDHIIREAADLNHHRNYILKNPMRWGLDNDFASA